jgi:hypothetical protein
MKEPWGTTAKQVPYLAGPHVQNLNEVPGLIGFSSRSHTERTDARRFELDQADTWLFLLVAGRTRVLDRKPKTPRWYEQSLVRTLPV